MNAIDQCKPDCEICGGNGYYRYDVPIGHQYFGKMFPCENILKSKLSNMPESELMSIYGLTKEESGLNWSHVKKNIGNVRIETQKAVDVIKPAFEKGYGIIAVLGLYGQGKTLIGKILTAQALQASKSCMYANMAKILDDIRKAFDEKEHMTKELLRRMDYWSELDVLFIDEIDKINDTQWASERMFELLDRRYTSAVRQEKLTVIAGNTTESELSGYLVSRLRDNRVGSVVHLQGDDYREIVPLQTKF